MGREAASPGEGFGEAPPLRRDHDGRVLTPILSEPLSRRAVKNSTSREGARSESVALRRLGGTRQSGVQCWRLPDHTRGPLPRIWPIILTCWCGPATLKDTVAAEAKGRELMDFAAEKEGMSRDGLQVGAAGLRLSLQSGREGVGGIARTEEAGGGEMDYGPTGMETVGDRQEENGQKADEMRVDLTVVKQEVVDWSEMEEGMRNGQWVKQEVEDKPEVKEEKPVILEVKQEMDSGLVVKEEKVEEPEVKEEKVKVKEEVMDWLEVKEEKKDNLEIKQEETFVGQNIKEEEVMDEICVKEEKYFPKKEMMDDTKMKEESQMNSPVGSKRKLAMSR